MTAPKIFSPEYYQRMRELEAEGWWNAGMRDTAALLLERAGLPQSGTMLDVGCGSGQSMMWFRERYPRWETVGLDVALDGLNAASAFGEPALLAASAVHLPIRDDTADLVLTFDVLQHLPLGGGDRTALEEMHRALRPGGHLLLRTNHQAFPRTPDDPEHDFHKYEASELRSKLVDAGFEVVRLSRLNALLGLAEIPRELRADRDTGRGYHGILAEARSGGLQDRLKRGWLRLEGRFVARGGRLPLGRTLVALGRKPG